MANSSDIWTIKAALDWTVGYLERKDDENPRLSAEWLLAEATSMRRVDLYVNFDRPLSTDERAVFRNYVARRAAGEPLQYITGEVAFRHIAVKVRPGVLIPRPETEVLVSEALGMLPARPRRCATDSLSYEEQAALASARNAGDSDGAAASVPATCEQEEGRVLVADICTGSGCIACSIAHEYPCAQVIATDISPEAVSLARENVSALGLAERVDVMECDLAGDLVVCKPSAFDLLVSNPPYIPDSVMDELPEEVSAHEPRLALAGGADGLDVFRRLLDQARILLKPGAAFAFELHEECLDAARDLACAAGYADVRVVDDLAGRPRILTGRRRG
ncbi:MAG: HemK/PrmC family methyltransferase [Slackia sp.]|nr:HemK/PrmC family methyltransferase [Slackia sp.]